MLPHHSQILCRLQFLRSITLFGIVGALVATSLSGCKILSSSRAQAQSDEASSSTEVPIPAVETAIAKTSSIDAPLEYSGTTEPIREVSIRPQIEGRLLDLSVNVGDVVNQGDVIGRVDEQLLTTEVNEAVANLAALRAEVAQAQTEVSNAEVLVEQARLELQQAESDAVRLRSLWQEGVVSEQSYELAETRRQTLGQAVQSAQERVAAQQQAVLAAQGRVAAQEAAVQQAEERRSYSLLTSSITGTVLDRVIEPGNLVQPGEGIITLGDFSAVKVVVELSELEFAQVQVGQPVQVRFDAFPNEQFQGTVARISLQADTRARLLPVEVIVPNRAGSQLVGSGLLARVNFTPRAEGRVVVPQSALEVGGEENPSSIFVAAGTDEEPRVEQRTVQVGRQINGQVEILSGLEPGEAFVAKSSQPLTDGQTVKMSILSETASP